MPTTGTQKNEWAESPKKKGTRLRDQPDALIQHRESKRYYLSNNKLFDHIDVFAYDTYKVSTL